jgi:hypothetical protein
MLSRTGYLGFQSAILKIFFKGRERMGSTTAIGVCFFGNSMMLSMVSMECNPRPIVISNLFNEITKNKAVQNLHSCGNGHEVAIGSRSPISLCSTSRAIK